MESHRLGAEFYKVVRLEIDKSAALPIVSPPPTKNKQVPPPLPKNGSLCEFLVKREPSETLSEPTCGANLCAKVSVATVTIITTPLIYCIGQDLAH